MNIRMDLPTWSEFLRLFIEQWINGIRFILETPTLQVAFIMLAIILVCIKVRESGFVNPDTDPITDKELR